jgi:hypothetical protein
MTVGSMTQGVDVPKVRDALVATLERELEAERGGAGFSDGPPRRSAGFSDGPPGRSAGFSDGPPRRSAGFSDGLARDATGFSDGPLHRRPHAAA